MLLDLHAHAGHRLTIGHESPASTTTVLWCDSCDGPILAVPNETGCEDEHQPEPEPAKEGAPPPNA